MKGRVKTVRPLLEPRKFLITGTPVSESPHNAFGILRILSPDKVPGRVRWDKHFVVRKKVRQKVAGERAFVMKDKAIQFQNLDEIKRMLEAISVRRLKIDIRGMPDKTEDVRYCDATADQAEHYAEIMKGVIGEIEGDPDWARTLDIACVKILRARQVLNHPDILDLSGDSGKYRELDNIVEEVLSNPEAKILIWTTWNKAVDLLADRYRAYGCITIDQRTSQDDLARYDRTFDQSKERVVIATPAKGGVGIDFLSRTRVAVYIEKTHSLVNHKQSIDRVVRRVPDDDPKDKPRIRRINQIKRSPATILYLHVPGSVDDVVARVLQIKMDLADALLTSDEKLLEEGRGELIQMLRERVTLR